MFRITLPISAFLAVIVSSAAIAHAASVQRAQSVSSLTSQKMNSIVLKVAMSDSERWNKLFRRHTYMGSRFPYHLRGKFTGNPNMPVRDRRRTIGNTYQCTYLNEGSRRVIICE